MAVGGMAENARENAQAKPHSTSDEKDSPKFKNRAAVKRIRTGSRW